MNLMKQKKIKIYFLLCEYITPTSFLYTYILLWCVVKSVQYLSVLFTTLLYCTLLYLPDLLFSTQRYL